jgi:hypothetical protein
MAAESIKFTLSIPAWPIPAAWFWIAFLAAMCARHGRVRAFFGTVVVIPLIMALAWCMLESARHLLTSTEIPLHLAILAAAGVALTVGGKCRVHDAAAKSP